MHEEAARHAFERWCVERLPDTMYRTFRGDDRWMTETQKAAFLAWRNLDAFKKTLAQKRRTGWRVAAKTGVPWVHIPWAESASSGIRRKWHLTSMKELTRILPIS